MAFLLYGANGYTGQLVAELAAARGLKPILAGRSAEKVRPLAEKLGLEWRAFGLDSPAALDEGLRGADLVLHSAGPFSQTSAPMVDACLRGGRHYLDLTGEVDVFEAVLGRDREAKEKGITLLPGAGFDVVPSDCLAALLHRALPTATSLELAFAPAKGTKGTSSAGTAKSAVEGLVRGGRVRRGGKLIDVPLAHETKEIVFPDGPRHCVAIPWGDLATAFRSTGIPDITVYMAMPRAAVAATRAMRLFAPALRWAPLMSFVQRRIEKNVAGPTEEQRRRARVHFWGRVSDGSRSVEGTMTVPEGYTLTAESALACAQRVLEGKAPKGAVTPSQAFGPDFAATLPGVSVKVG